jgi:hypothetical protein
LDGVERHAPDQPRHGIGQLDFAARAALLFAEFGEDFRLGVRPIMCSCEGVLPEAEFLSAGPRRYCPTGPHAAWKRPGSILAANRSPGSTIYVARDISGIDLHQIIINTTQIFSQLVVTAAS